MSRDIRQIMLAMLVAMAVFIGYRYIVDLVFPAPQRPPATAPSAVEAPPAAPPSSAAAPTTAMAATGSAPAGRPYVLSAGVATEPLTLGGEGDPVRIELRPRGAGIGAIWLTAKDKKGRYLYRTEPDVQEPYQLLHTVDDNFREYVSFATNRVWIDEPPVQNWQLDDLVWHVAEQTPDHVAFSTTLGSGEPDGDLLRLTKTFALQPTRTTFELTLAVENLTARPLRVHLEQDGPLGIPPEDPRADTRRLLTAQYTSSGVKLDKGQQRPALLAATRKSESVNLLDPSKGAVAWTLLTNKYFGVFTHPLPEAGVAQADWVQGVVGVVTLPRDDGNPGDLVARVVTHTQELRPSETRRYAFEIYAGAKDDDSLRAANPAYVNKSGLYYQLARSVDTQCCCTFLWLEDLMIWLLATIHAGVRNYGIAIIVLVIIVRTALHPLTVFQQKSMFRMQDSMSRLQPKLNALKEKFANDKVRYNQEMMKVWAEEGVNPAASIIGFLPLLIQMPILVALWTALNTDPHLRHAPFLVTSWWIRDLSAPDALINFPMTVEIPLLSWFMGPIHSLNLLPLLMGVSMWLQQKYMPKPHLQAKQAAAAQASASGKPRSGMSPEDQLRQQQIMMYMMSVLFPLMFYKMPAGLNLYWMATNVFGICESLVIRRQLDREKARRAREGPPAKKPDGLLAKFFRRIAAQAEQIQKKADEIGERDPSKRKNKP